MGVLVTSRAASGRGRRATAAFRSLRGLVVRAFSSRGLCPSPPCGAVVPREKSLFGRPLLIRSGRFGRRSLDHVREGQGLRGALGRAGEGEARAVRVRVPPARGRAESRADVPLGDPLGEEHNARRAARLPALLVVRLLGPVLRGARAPGHLRALLGGEGVPRLRLRQLGLWRERHRPRGASRRPGAPQRRHGRGRNAARVLPQLAVEAVAAGSRASAGTTQPSAPRRPTAVHRAMVSSGTGASPFRQNAHAQRFQRPTR